MIIMSDTLKIFSGNSNTELSKEIASTINASYGECLLTHFADGEIQFELKESVRGHDIFIVQPTSSTEKSSVNDNIMELLIMIDALKRSAADKINVVLPYYGYARQDRKEGSLSPITAKLVADILEKAGAKRIITLDLHSDQTQGFFNIPVENLNATKVLAEYFNKKNLSDVVIASPDMGGAKRASKMAKLMNDAPLVFANKRRPEPNVSEITHVVGDVKGKNVIIVDDMIDTAGTITNAAYAFIKEGAKNVYVCATHPVLSNETAIKRLESSPIKEVVVCNTIEIPAHKRMDKLTILSVASLLGEAIMRTHNNMSELMEY
jgi:ribose-phosphate pyrophosphokinase